MASPRFRDTTSVLRLDTRANHTFRLRPRYGSRFRTELQPLLDSIVLGLEVMHAVESILTLAPV